MENKKILTAIDGTVITANCMVRADTAVVTEKEWGGMVRRGQHHSFIHSCSICSVSAASGTGVMDWYQGRTRRLSRMIP